VFVRRATRRRCEAAQKIFSVRYGRWAIAAGPQLGEDGKLVHGELQPTQIDQ
jgi:hypothetical protein